MDTLNIHNDIVVNNNFINWLKETYKTDHFTNNEYDVLNIYTKIDYNFHEKLSIEYQTLPIEYNFPDIIMTDGNNYYVGISDYDKEIEYFTLRIKK